MAQPVTLTVTVQDSSGASLTINGFATPGSSETPQPPALPITGPLTITGTIASVPKGSYRAMLIVVEEESRSVISQLGGSVNLTQVSGVTLQMNGPYMPNPNQRVSW